MEITEVFDKVKKLFVDELGIEDSKVTMESKLEEDLEIDSLGIVEVVMAFEDEFNIEVKNINPMTARKQVFGKARVKGVKAKDFVKRQVDELYDTKKWCKHT